MVSSVGEEDFAVEGEVGQRSLLEYEDVVFVQSVVIVGGEDIKCLVVVEGAGHHIPGAGRIVFFGGGGNGFSEDLKEGFIFDGADGEVAFWAVEAEACSLSAGDDEGGDLALGDEVFAQLACLVVFSALGGGRAGGGDKREQGPGWRVAGRGRGLGRNRDASGLSGRNRAG